MPSSPNIWYTQLSINLDYILIAFVSPPSAAGAVFGFMSLFWRRRSESVTTTIGAGCRSAGTSEKRTIGENEDWPTLIFAVFFCPWLTFVLSYLFVFSESQDLHIEAHYTWHSQCQCQVCQTLSTCQRQLNSSSSYTFLLSLYFLFSLMLQLTVGWVYRRFRDSYVGDQKIMPFSDNKVTWTSNIQKSCNFVAKMSYERGSKYNFASKMFSSKC